LDVGERKIEGEHLDRKQLIEAIVGKLTIGPAAEIIKLRLADSSTIDGHATEPLAALSA
jgi:hypothetical protein